MYRILEKIKHVDWILLLTVVVLFSIGAAAIYSIGLGKDPQDFTFIQKQLVAFGIGMSGLTILSTIHYRTYRNISGVIYLSSCALLLLVLVLGDTIRGTKGWFALGPVSFQPAELAKIGLILMLATYFDKYTRQITQLRHIFGSGSIALLPIGLVLLQPDLGTAVILFMIWFGMMLVSGIPKRFLLALMILIITVASASWLFLFKDYQKDRVRAFINPTEDQLGRSYNIRQATIAIGSGELMGRGLGFGSQSHLKFLPENQTDFIFAVIAEEMGLVGVSLMFLFWILFTYRCVVGMRHARDDFALFSILGVAILLITEMCVNVGGNLGLVPITGIVLPFISYGGSSLVTSLVAIGIVESIRIGNK